MQNIKNIFKNENKLFAKENFVEEIQISEYIYLFNQFNFINITYPILNITLDEEKPKYLKVYNKNNIIAIAVVTQKRILKLNPNYKVK